MPAHQPDETSKRSSHEAHHVTRRGWSGLKDNSARLIVREEFVFVTNNARDFRKMMRETELHAGLVVIIPNVTPTAQRELFQRALDEASKLPDIINRVIEIDAVCSDLRIAQTG